MVETEQTIVDGVVDALEEGDEVPPASEDTTPLHGGGPDSSAGLNYSSGSSASGGGVVGQHEAGGTRPLTDYVAPTGAADDADAALERADAFAAVVAQVRIDRAIADESFRRFCKGPVISTGHVSGVELLQFLQDQKRTKS